VRSHVRYFIRRNVTIRIHNEAIENFEVILPSSRPYVRAETKLQLKNAEITACFQASNVYFDSVGRKLNVLDGGVTDPARLNDLRLKLATLLDELESERRAFLLSLAKSAREVRLNSRLCRLPLCAGVLTHLLSSVVAHGCPRHQSGLEPTPGDRRPLG